jgi:hypothetical protein
LSLTIPQWAFIGFISFFVYTILLFRMNVK